MAKKKTTKTAVATATKTKEKGLRKPQQRILVALSKSRGAMNRVEIAKKGNVDVAGLVEYLGSSDPAKRKANDVKHFPSLLSLGLVKEVPGEEGAGARYEITVDGRKAIAAL